MGLLQRASETYDNMSALAGVEREGKRTLAPVSHISVKANILITLDKNGGFVSAEAFEEQIVIPVTIESANRTGDNHIPHALCDQMRYLMPDYEDKYKAYCDQLEDWRAQDDDPKLYAVLEYVRHGTMMRDLKEADLLKYDKETGELKNVKDMVCWRVLGAGEPEKVWADRRLHESFIRYYKGKLASTANALCYVSGSEDKVLQFHLKGVVPAHGNAKLISSNDTSNFTYLGRFKDNTEAATVSYEASQKAHNALKWIVENDAVYEGERAFICWNPKGVALPKPTRSLFSRKDSESLKPSAYHKELGKILNGYKADLKIDDAVAVAVFDAANSGRLAVAYYNEFGAHDFLERLRYWDETCCCYSGIWGTSSPNLQAIANAAYGSRFEDKKEEKIKTDDKLMGPLMQRLLECRIDGAKFPSDVMRAAVQKCGNLQIYTRNNREMLLFTTCAVIRKFYIDRTGEVIDMALEPERKDRSYQYGRLLAVLEKAEYDTYDENEKKNRETNAIRLQSVYVKRPAYAAKLIIEQVKKGYYAKLDARSRVFYERKIGEIMAMISECGEDENKPLTETYLMGYYLQKNALWEKKNNNNTEKTAEEEL